MALEDIRIKFGFKDHSKRKRLNLALGLQKSATDYLIDLWIYVAQNHPKGHLNGMDDIDIAMAAGWEGDPSTFVVSIGPKPLGCGFLDKDEIGYFIHDWEEHQPWIFHSKERSKKARHAALVRHGLLQADENDATSKKKDASSTKDAMPPSLPIPSLPYPSLPTTEPEASPRLSKHWEDNIEEYWKRIKVIRDELVKEYKMKDVDLWIQMRFNENGHQGAILYCLEEALKKLYKDERINNFIAYATKIFKKENPNFINRDKVKMHEFYKNMEVDNFDIKKILDKIGDI